MKGISETTWIPFTLRLRAYLNWAWRDSCVLRVECLMRWRTPIKRCSISFCVSISIKSLLHRMCISPIKVSWVNHEAKHLWKSNIGYKCYEADEKSKICIQTVKGIRTIHQRDKLDKSYGSLLFKINKYIFTKGCGKLTTKKKLITDHDFMSSIYQHYLFFSFSFSVWKNHLIPHK